MEAAALILGAHEAEAGGLQLQDLPGLGRELKASLDHLTRPCLKA